MVMMYAMSTGIARITATTTEDKQALIESRSKGCTEICIVLKR
ncbi:hypothetical protein HanOQP8_Chr08g0278671 [Helianthus annuus]|nr:hypothetical protein HanOQP8_Chr08g0278671 [Helianthus annuus]